MECPHLSENIASDLSTIDGSITNNSKKCSVCNTVESPWICLQCGCLNCGRYINEHAKAHFEKQSSRKHSVCMDYDNCSVFCYLCDEYVINDTPGGLVEQVRQRLRKLQREEEEETETKENKVQGSRKSNSSDSAECSNSKRLKMSQKTVENSKKKVKAKSPGLRNLGNTCFMNAVLQSLSNIQSFCGYIKLLPSFEQKTVKKIQTRSCKDGDDVWKNGLRLIRRSNWVEQNSKWALTQRFVVEELRKTLVALAQEGKGAISPDTLFSVIWKVVPRFRGYQQQDAHEFMRYLLDRLHTELLTLLPYINTDSQFIGPKGKSTIVTTVFGGILQSEVKCLVCGAESKKHDPFLDLSLDIPARFSNKSSEPKMDEICDITDCLSSFTELEELEDSELYMCTHCKQKQRSTKKFWVKSLPYVLCLHLKRFRWSTFYRMKVDVHVEFPLRGLDVSRYALNLHGTRHSGVVNSMYDLAACVVHHGSGAGSGHYTSYAIHDNHWYHFNDSNVTVCDEETVLNCKAYILFYVKRDANIKLPDSLRLSAPASANHAT